MTPNITLVEKMKVNFQSVPKLASIDWAVNLSNCLSFRVKPDHLFYSLNVVEMKEFHCSYNYNNNNNDNGDLYSALTKISTTRFTIVMYK